MDDAGRCRGLVPGPRCATFAERAVALDAAGRCRGLVPGPRCATLVVTAGIVIGTALPGARPRPSLRAEAERRQPLGADGVAGARPRPSLRASTPAPLATRTRGGVAGGSSPALVA